MDVMAGLQHLFREIASKAPRSAVPALVAATVESVSPLRVILDSDVTSTPREADSTWVGQLALGQAVRCELLNSALTVTQAAGQFVPWASLTRSAAGTATFTLSTTVTTHNVALPAGRFTGAPIVIPSLTSGTQRCRVDNISAVAFRIVVWDATTMTGTASVGWHAIATH